MSMGAVEVHECLSGGRRKQFEKRWLTGFNWKQHSMVERGIDNLAFRRNDERQRQNKVERNAINTAPDVGRHEEIQIPWTFFREPRIADGNRNFQMVLERRADRDEKKRRNCYVRGLTLITKSVNKFYEELAGSLIKRTWVWILCCLLVIGICGIGVIRLTTEIRAEKLYIPQSSKAEKDMETITPYFPTFLNTRVEEIGFVPKSGDNFMVPLCISEAKKLLDDIRASQSYANLCIKEPLYIKQHQHYQSFNDCLVLNAFELFSNGSNAIAEFSLSLGNQKKLMSNGKIPAYNKDEMIAQYEIINGTFTKIKFIRVKLYMKNPSDKTHILKWELDFTNFIEKQAKNFKCALVYFSSQRSLDDAIVESVQDEPFLMIAAFGIMVLFSVITLAKFSNPVTGHALLAIFGVISTVLGIGGGFAASLATGTPFVSILTALPFLVLSIGIDDMFIIVDEFDRITDEDDHEKRVQTAMSHIGATITMTTLTDIVAFAVSMQTDFPAIRYFCIFAVITFVIEFSLQVTFFVALLVLDARRIRSRKPDLVCCRIVAEKETTLSKRVAQKYATFLVSWPGKTCVLIIAGGLLAGGVYGCLNVSQEFTPKSLAKDGSHLLSYLTNIQENFDTSIPVQLAKVKEENYSSRVVQNEIESASKSAIGTGFYKSSYVSWIEQYNLWLRNSATVNKNNTNFNESLQQFLSIPSNAHFYGDLVFNVNNEIIASRTHVFIKSKKKSTFHRDAMIEIRRTFTDKNISSIPFANEFLNLEQLAVAVDEIILNTCFTAGVVFFITLPFCVNPIVVVFLSFGFASMITELIGLMYFWDVSLNSISMINLVMSIGFAMDYSAHIAHSFIVSNKPTPNERVIDSISNIGVSVLMGGISTFLGMVVTSISKSEIFRIFFRIVFGIVVFGLFNGLAVLPVMFSIFGRFIKPIGNE